MLSRDVMQPLILRLLKFAIYIALAILFRDTALFWIWFVGWPLLSVAIHVIYRYKTRDWTQPWGGWHEGLKRE
jgi:hypothetical protein